MLLFLSNTVVVLDEQAEMKDLKLPPKEERLFEGVMSKEVLSSKGVLWQQRHAILSAEYLTFCKKDTTHLEDRVPQLEVSMDELWDAFDKQDGDHDGSLGNNIPLSVPGMQGSGVVPYCCSFPMISSISASP